MNDKKRQQKNTLRICQDQKQAIPKKYLKDRIFDMYIKVQLIQEATC